MEQQALCVEKLKGIFIDLDGTLVDSMPLFYTAYLHFLKQNGHVGNKEEFNAIIGATLPDMMTALSERYALKQTSQDLIQLFMKMLKTHYSKEIKIFPGAQEFLNFAKALKLKLALVTSAPRELVDSFLKGHGLLNTFDLIITPDDVVNGKPSPEVFEFALHKFELEPNEALAIEDSSVGVKAAVGAGISTIKLTHGDETHPDKYCILLKDWHEVLYLFQAGYR